MIIDYKGANYAMANKAAIYTDHDTDLKVADSCLIKSTIYVPSLCLKNAIYRHLPLGRLRLHGEFKTHNRL